MTRDELFEVAEKVGLGFIRHASDKDIEKFEGFAKLVAQHEREACAEVCKKHADFYAGLEPSPIAQSAWAACIDNRDTILARGQA
jgi:hypothetical protein